MDKIVNPCNKLTTWSRVCLEKLTVPELVKKLPTFHGIWSLICVHKNPKLALILRHINGVHMVPSYFSKIHFNISLTTIPVLPNDLFPSGFPKNYFMHLTRLIHDTFRVHPLWFDHLNNIMWGVTDLTLPYEPDTCHNLPPGVSHLHHQMATQHAYYAATPSGLWAAPAALTSISYVDQRNCPLQPEGPYWVSSFSSADRNVTDDACSWHGCTKTASHGHSHSPACFSQRLHLIPATFEFRMYPWNDLQSSISVS